MDISEKRERLAPLLARLGPKTPPGMISVGPGWIDLVLKLDQELAALDPDYAIGQVKEKFGGLRFYAIASEDYAYDGTFIESPFFQAINRAESLSYKTCEDCGAPGEERGGNWTIVLCEPCLARRGEDRRIK